MEYYEIKQPSRKLKVRLVAVFVICALCFSLMVVKQQPTTSDFMFLVDNATPESSDKIDNTHESDDRIDGAPTAYNYQNLTTCNASEIALNLNDMKLEEDWQEIYTDGMSCEVGDFCTAFLSPTQLSDNGVNQMQLYNKAIVFDTAENAVAYFNNLETEVEANYTLSHYNIGDDGYLIEMDGYDPLEQKAHELQSWDECEREKNI